MPCTVLSTLYVLPHQILIESYEQGTISIHTLEIKEKTGEGKANYSFKHATSIIRTSLRKLSTTEKDSSNYFLSSFKEST
jgi:hypothetical protein